ncbi:MAG: VCBS repeat-containing protein [Acidobacteria bacterium]|nr:VCBS repeat-containing protein [Acidobacteriota bacterium]
MTRIGQNTAIRVIRTAAIAGFVLGMAPDQPPQPEFTETVIRVGQMPGPITVADVNHDGRPDIMVGNMKDGTVSILLGDGRGQFRPAPGSPFPCNANPNDIAVADMDGDGNPDLVIANTQTPYITILLGDGKGGFRPSPHSPFATQSFPHPHRVAVGDFLGDGEPAVVTDSWGHNEILVIPSDGKGNLLLPGKFFPADLHSDSGVIAADFNKDGKLDIVTVNQSEGVVGLLLGDGKGGFRKAPGSPFPAGDTPWSFTVGDLNRDGNPDVAVIPYERDIRDPRRLGVTILLGNGKGGFDTMPGSPLSLAGCKGPSRVAIGDIRGDGSRGLVISCAQNDKLFFFVRGKNGGFESFSQGVSTGWGGLALADLTGRGKDDVLLSNEKEGTITILSKK